MRTNKRNSNILGIAMIQVMIDNPMKFEKLSRIVQSRMPQRIYKLVLIQRKDSKTQKASR